MHILTILEPISGQNIEIVDCGKVEQGSWSTTNINTVIWG